jgi:Flp pilus assembly pilin Flp
MSPQRRRTADEQGAALVEFTLVLPVLLLVVIGVTSLLWVGSARSKLDNVTREAARYASVAHDPYCDTPPCPTGYPDAADVRRFVVERTGYRDDADLVVVLDPADGDRERNEAFTVTVRRPLPDLFRPIVRIFGDRDLAYSSTVVGRAE